MFFKSIIFRLFIFTLLFTFVFFVIRTLNILPPLQLHQNIDSIPWLFSAVSLIFSIISGFVIQSKWHTWDALIDATHGELNALRQLHILAHHFPKNTQTAIKHNISDYLQSMIKESKINTDLDIRSERVETAIYQLEETVFDIDYKQHPNIGAMTFDLVRKCMDYREKRLQNVAHKLPQGVKIFVISTTFFMIFSSLFIGVESIIYDYVFTLMIALLSYGIYLLIDDLDHPYRPGQWHLKIDDYENLLEEIKEDKIVIF